MSFFERAYEYIKLVTVFDVIDILIVTILIYQLIKFIRGTSAERLLKGLVILMVATWVSDKLFLNVVNFILNAVMQVGVLALVIIFQPELRKVLEQFGKSRISLFHAKISDRRTLEVAISNVMEAVGALSWAKTGALIVFERNDTLKPQIDTGTVVNADVNSELLKNIFYNKAPLHDGAVIISGARIEAAGCILPLSSKLDLSKDLGTRHRAAVGMSEVTDALSVVVSEETGSISFSSGGMLKRHLAPETLERLLINELIPADNEEKQTLAQRIRGVFKK